MHPTAEAAILLLYTTLAEDDVWPCFYGIVSVMHVRVSKYTCVRTIISSLFFWLFFCLISRALRMMHFWGERDKKSRCPFFVAGNFDLFTVKLSEYKYWLVGFLTAV